MTEEESTPWMLWTLQGVLVLVVSVVPLSGVLFLVLLVPWVPQSWIGPTLLISWVIFLFGTGMFVATKEWRKWAYSIVVGLAVGIGCITLATASMLSQIPFPLFGNAFFAILTVLTLIAVTMTTAISVNSDTKSAGLLEMSSKSSSSPLPSLSLLRAPQQTQAIELLEIPHDYAFSEDGKHCLHEVTKALHSMVRSLTDIPWAFRIQRVKWKTRVLFHTWSKDENLLGYQTTKLHDALRENLKGFKVQELNLPAGLSLSEEEKGAAIVITGVPLSIEDDSQRKDPLEPLAGVLQSLENGLYQVFFEPSSQSNSQIRSLEAQHRRASEQSETTQSRETTSLFLGTHQESRTVVDLKAKRKADLLERQVERLSGQFQIKTTVTALSWSNDIAKADINARRIASILVGALRPDRKQQELTLEYKRKQKDVISIMEGLPKGSSTILTPDEATIYCLLPRALEVKVTKRERFSTGSSSIVEDAILGGATAANGQVIERSPDFILGNAIDERGIVNPHAYVKMSPDGLDMHLGVWGSTRMGKTTLIVSLVGQAISKGINPIVMVPSKGFDYDMLMDLYPEVRVFTCGRADVANLVYNPWNPPEGVRLTKWVDRVVEVWTLWMPNDKIISMHVDDVVHKIYEICGWDLENNKWGRPILLKDVVKAVNLVCNSLTYGAEVNNNIKGALISRVKSILRKPSLVKMFNTKTGLTISQLMSHPTILRMDDLSESDKILVMGLLTAAVSEYKLANPAKQVTNLLVLEEAHYLLGRTDITGEANSAVRLQAIHALIEMLRVLGGTGLGVVLVDQIPSELVPKAVKIPVNTVVFALTHEEDKELAGKRARCTDSQIEHISGMKVGEAVVFLQREGQPQNVMMLPLSKIVPGMPAKGLTGEEAVRKHMQPAFEQHPELCSSEPLPSDIIERLTANQPEPPKQWFERIPAEIRKQIEAAVRSESFKEYCGKKIVDENVIALVKLIQKTCAVRGDGSWISGLYVLDQMVKCYKTPDNQPVFDSIAQKIDEARPR
ncbi:MAG: hypothetical protein ACFFER_11170 [Candidatus Thorarchaeota archaeon]